MIKGDGGGMNDEWFRCGKLTPINTNNHTYIRLGSSYIRADHPDLNHDREAVL